MPTHLALLRGVNVGGHNKLAMADLRAAVEALGGVAAKTYIQSGNVVFSTSSSGFSGAQDLTGWAGALEEELARRSGVRCDAIVLTRDQLAEVILANPYPGETDPRHLHAVVMRRPLDAAGVEAVAELCRKAAERGSPDQASAEGSVLYLRTPEGLGRSWLAAAIARMPGAGVATARNWATIEKLMELLDQA
jgi:uncharacterized protein (DUF1697 family)